MASKVINEIAELSLKELVEKYEFAADFFDFQGLKIKFDERTLNDYLENLDDDEANDLGIDKDGLTDALAEYIESVAGMNEEDVSVNSINIIGGHGKDGTPEDFSLTINKGEIVSIVGPTGSGKSRLLADIEWVAQADTPTKRTVLINGEKPDMKWRFSTEHKLVAQLSQNMNFVMDLTASEFVDLHAESRLVKNREEKVKLIIEKANELAGEPFAPDTPVTALSGGQSRALMIADVAYLSRSPIVLIDEIENAGIDRKKALELLTGEEKIVLMATHDPILALMGDRRLVIKGGRVAKIIEVTEKERSKVEILEEIDRKMLDLRNRIRFGETLEDLEM